MELLNLGILAHVDAGKTSLTERILFETGVIARVGRVDKGTTQTDTLELERARGITIKSAVVSFRLHDLKVNLIDTPGHADFVAEVERSLLVLDAVVLVVSAVEGVQPQTRRLARAVRAAGLPLIVFVNKIDRIGARDASLLADLRRRLDLRILPMTIPAGLGDRAAHVISCDRAESAWREAAIDLLAESSERTIAEFDRTGGEIGLSFIEREFRAQVASGAVVPVYFGSAITGAGVTELLAGIETWMPRTCTASDAPASGTVFKIQRRATGEPVVYVRLFTGSLAVRQRIPVRRRDPLGDLTEIEERITAIDQFESGATLAVESAGAGEIVGLHGLRAARIGDQLGDQVEQRALGRAFPAPALESVVRPVVPAQITRLRSAMEQLAEQDPLISLRQRNHDGDISVRLFGEVQKEVLTETLANDYGIAVHFGATRTVCVERIVGTGQRAEIMSEGDNPFYATIGFRIASAPPGSEFQYERDLGALPLAFYRAIEETARETLTQGLHGWEVPDCRLTLTHAGFSAPVSTAADFRKLTPLVLMQALLSAGTIVCEPFEQLDIELPTDCFGAVCGALVLARAALGASTLSGEIHRLVCEVPTAELRGLEQQLPGLTRGEGSWLTTFAGYVPVSGDPPVRPRVGPNPLNRAQYLADVARS